MENLRETPLRNAVLAYLGDPARPRDRSGGPAASGMGHRQRRTGPRHRRADRAASCAAFADPLPRRRTGRLGRPRTGSGRPDRRPGIESAAIRGLGLLAAGHPRRAADGIRRPGARVRHGAQAQRVAMGRGWVQFIRDDVDGARASLESAVAAARSRRLDANHAVGVGLVGQGSVRHRRVGPRNGQRRAGRDLASSSGIVITTPMLEWTAAQIARAAWRLAGSRRRCRAPPRPSPTTTK